MIAEQKPRILGVNTRHYPMQGNLCKNRLLCDHIAGQCGDPPPSVAVLVAGEVGDYACYVGHGSPQWVAQYGSKIQFGEACCHFPGQLEKELYRS